VGGELHRFEGEGEVTDCGVADAFGADSVVPNVVGGPANAEAVAAGDEFSDEIGEGLVVWVLAGVAAESGDDAVGALFPVGVIEARCGAEEGEAGIVAAAGWVVDDRRE